MKKINQVIIFVILLILLLHPVSVYAQGYYFQLPSLTVDYYINEDGTGTIDYEFVFQNEQSGSAIQYVDVGLPTAYFDGNNITATIDGKPISDISTSDFQGKGDYGVAINLGSDAIQPGDTGIVQVTINNIGRILFPDTETADYASTNFAPSYFGTEFVNGYTNSTVTFHLPPGILPEEPKWHSAPKGWSTEPITGVDESGRVTYTWNNPQATADRLYEFGASFPIKYIPQETVSKPTVGETVEDSTGVSLGILVNYCMCFGVIGIIIFVVYRSLLSSKKRKLQYLPPKISIEGNGIKRGLTAIEAAILLEQPLDKILTMILFSVVKKGAAKVIDREPLTIEKIIPLPEGLRAYETEFLEAFDQKQGIKPDYVSRKKALQQMMINLVNSVSNSMKGFSRKDTIAYYRDIMRRAWEQVEVADTPEVKMEKYSENIEWTMLDQNYDERAKNVFQSGPIVVPTWWHHFDPSSPPSVPRVTSSVKPSATSPSGPSGGGGLVMPTLPGSTFAASIVQGVQNFSKNVVGNISDFTGSITQKTNPPPPPTTSSSRGGGRSGGISGGHSCACACACACAGCACACAGGGR
jgi:hypothetical protein